MVVIGIIVSGIFTPPAAGAAEALSPDEAAAFRQCLPQPPDAEKFFQCLRQHGLQRLLKDSPQPPEPPPTPKVGENVSQEFFRYIEPKMAHACGKEIYHLIKYEIRSPGIFWGKNSGQNAAFLLNYSRISRRVAEDGTIRLLGDEAEAQNGLGNWARISYSCTVDVATNSVRSATITNGKLD